MKYNLHLLVRRRGDNRIMLKSKAYNKSMLYVIRTLRSWSRHNVSDFDYTLTIKRSDK